MVRDDEFLRIGLALQVPGDGDELRLLGHVVEHDPALLLDVARDEEQRERAQGEVLPRQPFRERAERDAGRDGQRDRQHEQMVVVERVVVGEERERDRGPAPQRPHGAGLPAAREQNRRREAGDDEPGERRPPVQERGQLVPLVDHVRRVARVAVIDDDALPELAEDVAVDDGEHSAHGGGPAQRSDEHPAASGPIPEKEHEERRHGEHGVRLHRHREREHCATGGRDRERAALLRDPCEPEGDQRDPERGQVGEHPVGEEREGRSDRQQRRSRQARDRPRDRPSEQVCGDAGEDGERDHPDLEAAHRVGAGEGDDP